MILYFIVILYSIFCLIMKYDKGKLKKGSLISMFSILTLIALFRGVSVGTDTIQYYTNFPVIGSLGWNQASKLRYEHGFFYFCKLLYSISREPQFLIIISSLIVIPLVGIFVYKYSLNYSLSTFFYITLNIYFFNLTAMRQSLAIAFLLLGFNYFYKRKRLLFVIFVLLASEFHSSAIVFLILILLDKIKYSKKTYYIYLILTAVSFVGYSPIFSIVSKILGKYSSYSTSKEFGVSNYYGAFFQFAIVLFLFTICHFLYINQIKNGLGENQKNNELFLKCIGISMICQAMAMRMNIIGRISPYFWIFSIILIPNIIQGIKNGKKRFLILSALMLICLSYWFIVGIFRPEWNGAIPYVPYWEK